MTDLNALIERLEKASGSDRELDGQIEAALGCPAFSDTLPALTDGWRWTFEDDDVPGRVTVFLTLANKTSKKHKRYDAPHYTSSIDAAMTLVPEKHGWALNYASMASVIRLGPNGAIDGEIVSSWPDDQREAELPVSPAIALCIASLRARAI